MSHFHELVPFTQLTRFSMPQFTVARRPMTISGQELPVGAVFPIAAMPNRNRVRQLYEQRVIAVVADSIQRGPGISDRLLNTQIQQDALLSGRTPDAEPTSSARTPGKPSRNRR